jgi:hypothetical protein
MNQVMISKVRVPSTFFALGGWRGTLDIYGDVLRVVGEDPSKLLDIDCAQIKRYSFNSNNGLWVFRMKDGQKFYLQTSGMILSADRSPAGRQANAAIEQLLRKHQARRFP